MPEEQVGCAKPTGKVIGQTNEPPSSNQSSNQESDIPMVTARVGHPAPDFEAPAYYKGKFVSVKLSDYAGKWVLVCFYPGDFTFVWPTELSAVAGHYDELQKLGVEVLSASTDSKFIHKMWVEHELSKMTKDGIPWPMLDDGAGNLGKVYGVYDELSGTNIRGRFLIDPDGIIQAAEMMTPPVGRMIGETIRQLHAFQHVRKTKGAEACPAEWQPGKPTLKPGPDLVGNVWKAWQPA